MNTDTLIDVEDSDEEEELIPLQFHGFFKKFLPNFPSSHYPSIKIEVKESSAVKKILFLLFVHLNLVICNTIWGTMQVTNKWALDNYFSPIVFSSVRFYIATPCLLLVCVASLNWDLRQVIPKKGKDFLLMGLFGISLGTQQSIYITGLSYTSASNTAVLGCLSPAFGLIFALILRRERFYILKLVGILFSVAGTLVVVDVFSMEFTASAFGDLLIITSAVFVALNFLFQEYLSKLIGNSQQIVFWSIAFAAIELTVISLIFHFDEWEKIPEFPFQAWIPVIYAAVFATAFCYGMNGWCMKFTTPLIVISYISIQPISATMLEYFLGGNLTLFFVIGSTLVIMGIFFVLAGRYQETRALKKKIEQNNNNDSNNSTKV